MRSFEKRLRNTKTTLSYVETVASQTLYHKKSKVQHKLNQYLTHIYDTNSIDADNAHKSGYHQAKKKTHVAMTRFEVGETIQNARDDDDTGEWDKNYIKTGKSGIGFQARNVCKAF